ncbi:hypothetical protein GRI89_05725 [Altererythrobacter salegens]|uniref:Uncharacterized protein n=1 Tax=Croceibacterium salegens TaxID=1737568 RepID=A0A6I4SW73_9SPHN|nr:hypothetical protein [Croceibacterium salegens]MXO59036.1 hypothetical protein [Croceibacterium salegens]
MKRIGMVWAPLALLAQPYPAVAQEAPEDLASVSPVRTDYVPAKTEWGDPDLRGTWPIEHVNEARIPIEREEEFGTRAWLTPEEYAERLKKAQDSDGGFSADLRNNGTSGLADWIERTEIGHRNSMIIDPPDGRRPALLPDARTRHESGRASWVEGQPIDWVTDLDIWDRCVSPGFPAAMFSFPYENGIRVFQSPGYVVIDRAMLGARIIPLGKEGHWPAAVRGWMGSSLGHWEGNTLVVETTNIVPGDSATYDVAKRAASPTYDVDQAIPVGPDAKAVERLTMLDPDRLIYEITYSDPDVFSAPWTARLDWVRDENYQFFEFACHEGNSQVRHMINSSRAQRKLDAAAATGVEQATP